MMINIFSVLFFGYHQKLKQIQPTYFAFRWLTCLLTQEFALPEVIRLWDSVLADLAVDICGDRDTQCDTSPREGKFEFLIDICCAMIMYAFVRVYSPSVFTLF